MIIYALAAVLVFFISKTCISASILYSYRQKAEASVDKLSWKPHKDFYKVLRPINTGVVKTMLYSYLGALVVLALASYIFFTKDTLIVIALVIAIAGIHLGTYAKQYASAPTYCFNDSGIWIFPKMYFSFATKSKLFVPWSKINTYTVYDKHHINVYTHENKDLDLIISGNGIDQVVKYLDHYIQTKL